MIWECAQYQADEGGRIPRATQDYRSKGSCNSSSGARKKEIRRPRQTFLEKLSLSSHKEEEWRESFSIANPYDKWNDIGEQFMARSLTKDYDVLPALAGIARVFQNVLEDKYCAVLAYSHLPRKLLGWHSQTICWEVYRSDRGESMNSWRVHALCDIKVSRY
jgi:hypothetical protein